jgi:xanthine dehydrogenase accessory factor
MQSVFRSAVGRLRAGEPVALVSVVDAKGSVPRHAGAYMAVFADGSAEGTVGGGAVEHAAQAHAKEIMGGTGEIRRYNLTREDAAGLGMICGGDVTLFFNPIQGGDEGAIAVFEAVLAAMEARSPVWLTQALQPDGTVRMALYDANGLMLGEPSDSEPPKRDVPVFEDGERVRFTDPVVRAGRALIFGGGHVSRALSPILESVGFPVFVFEDREEFSDIARFPGASGVTLCQFDDFLDGAAIGPEDFVVIVTRGHQADYEVLRQVLCTRAAYVGMIGSRAKVTATKEKLIADGFMWDNVARVYAPIGLAIGAETPEEIAVSIAAEMIKMRSQLRAER